MKKKVYGYIRVSTETQADKGYGLDTQRNAIIEYCNNNDLELIDIFSDEGISGTIGIYDDITKRPGLTELLASLKNINTIIVMNRSRIWRDQDATVLISREIKKLKGDLISIEEPQYSLYNNNPENTLINGVMELLDTYERMKINLRLAKGRTTKAKQGSKPAGRQPLGYEYSQDKKNTIINQTQASVIRDIFRLRIEGLSLNQIADKLNSSEYMKKYKNAYNKPKNWINQSVDKILKNDYYIGVLTHANEKFHGKHEPIIDMDTWNAVNKNAV